MHCLILPHIPTLSHPLHLPDYHRMPQYSLYSTLRTQKQSPKTLSTPQHSTVMTYALPDSISHPHT